MNEQYSQGLTSNVVTVFFKYEMRVKFSEFFLSVFGYEKIFFHPPDKETEAQTDFWPIAC